MGSMILIQETIIAYNDEFRAMTEERTIHIAKKKIIIHIYLLKGYEQ